MLRTMFHLVVLLPVQLLLSSVTFGQADVSLYVGAGKPGTESFELGVGITSLVKVRLLPSNGIDLTLVETAGYGVVGDLLIINQETLATLTGLEPITGSQRADLRSIMAFQPNDFGAGPSLELIARADVSAEAVYLISKVILENSVFLEDLNQRSWNLSADQALTGLNLPLHPGAIRYYQDIGEANLSIPTAEKTEAGEKNQAATLQQDSTFLLEFRDDATTLDQSARRQIAEACQYASIFNAERITVAGYSGTYGSDVGRGSLARERERYVVAALRSNTSCAENVEVVLADGSTTEQLARSLASRLDQVEVTIMFTK